MDGLSERFVEPDRWLLGVLHASRKELISRRAGMSAAGFAKLVNCAEGTVRRYLRNERPIPMSVLQAWERATGLAPGTLTGDRGEARRPLLLDQRPPLPVHVSADSRPFVGRRAELGVLRKALMDGSASRRVMLVAGDPGIGKTRLAAVTAKSAFGDGATVLWGRCDEHLRLPFQPFADALRPFVPNFAALIDPEAESRQGRDAWELARERLFEDIADLLAKISAHHRTVLVVDDAHWASGSSVQLLRHLMLVERHIALAMIVTYNTAELTNSALAPHLDEFVGREEVGHLLLEGLAESEVDELLAGRTTVVDRTRLARSLCTETGGNPFLLGEMILDIAERGDATTEGSGKGGRPRASAQAVLNQRLARRSARVLQLLPAAATLGLSFDFAVLVAMFAGKLSESEVVEGLEEARGARLVEELGPLHYRFAHNLVRAAVTAPLTDTQRALLHRSAADALEAVHAEDLDTVRPALAHHLHTAGPAVPLPRRVDAIGAAAAQCVAQFDRGGAKQYASLGLALLESAGADDPARRCDLLILGGTLTVAGDEEQLEWLRLAARDAESIGDHDRLATAVALFGDMVRVGGTNANAIALCNRCLEILAPDDDINRARVLAVLIFNLAWSGRGGAALQGRLRELCEEAVERVARHDDPLVRWRVYDAYSAALDGSSDLALRLRVAEQAISPRVGSSWQRAPALIASGDRAAFEQILAEFAASRHYWDVAAAAEWSAMLALAEGRWDDAAAHAADALAVSRGDANFATVYSFQMAVLLWETGHLGELVDTAANASTAGYAPAIGALGLAHLEAGDREGARCALATLVGALDDIGRDFSWTAVLAIIIELGVRLHEPTPVASAAALLRPFSGQLIVVATGTHLHGAVDRFLAMAAQMAGESVEARRLFESAIRLEVRFGASALSRRTRMWQARALLASEADEDRRRGEQLRDDVLTEAEAVGQTGLRTL